MNLSHQQLKGTAAEAVLPPDVETLEIIADWKEDLQTRIKRAQLRFELLDADLDLTALQEEVDHFKRACRALTWRAPA
jgi:hypothetical protein